MAPARPNREQPDRRRQQPPGNPNPRWQDGSPRSLPAKAERNADETCAPSPDEDTALWSFVFEDDIDAD